MVYRKTRWKWHECLQARDELIDNDSECENDDYLDKSLLRKGLTNQPKSTAIDNTNEDIFTKLQDEAKIAFVVGGKMARMQVKLEREASEKKKTSLYDLIGINVNIDKPFTPEILEEMNIGQLQVIINDLHNLIDENNDQLVHLLMDRDSLSMEQDSILVDIEDVRKRLQERAMYSSKQSSINELSECIYIVKRPQEDIPKRSIFHNLLRKAMFS